MSKKRVLATGLSLLMGVAVSGAVLAQDGTRPYGPGYGMGPGMGQGMMGGYGPGYGMGQGMMGGYGPGYGMGQGMMGGYGPGYGMGPGMMGGYGPGYGMGPGMMGGYGPGYGMGPGMMYGDPDQMPWGGPGMRGPGMMGPGVFGALDLSDQQREQIAGIMAEQRKQQWERRARMQEAMAEVNRLYAQESPDPKAVGEAYDKINRLRREMVESRIEAHNRMRQLLNEKQRQQLRSYGWGGQP